MGAGAYGGFGNTFGSIERLRIGVSVPITLKNIQMALYPQYYSRVIVKKFNIHLKGAGIIF